MNFNNGDEVSFFKILPSDSVDYLPLPAAFAEKYLEKGNKKQTLFLKTTSAVKWSVKYFKIEDKYYIMDGWLKFTKDNRLQIGDFLVFRLFSPSPDSIFQVFIYAQNGCLKNPLSSSGARDHGKKPFVKEESIDEDDDEVELEDETSDDDGDDFSLVNVHKSLRRVFCMSYSNSLSLSKRFWNATGIDGYGGVRLRNDEGKMWEVKVRKYGINKLPYLTRGWSEFWKGNKLEVKDICEFNHVNGNLFHVHVIKKKNNLSN